MEDEEVEKKEYIKKPLSIEEQVEKLKSRGLIIDDKYLAESYLSNISYYRLRAYTFPFQNNADIGAEHKLSMCHVNTDMFSFFKLGTVLYTQEMNTYHPTSYKINISETKQT